jgi:hypothetical protein
VVDYVILAVRVKLKVKLLLIIKLSKLIYYIILVSYLFTNYN